MNRVRCSPRWAPCGSRCERCEECELHEPPPDVPRWLAVAGAWSWRLIAIGVVVYFAVHELVLVKIVLLPLLAAIVITALLRPLRLRLEGGVGRLGATWLTFIIAILVVAGVTAFVTYLAAGEFHSFQTEFTNTVHKLRHYLVTGPFHLKETNLNKLGSQIGHWLSQHRATVVSGAVKGATVIAEFLAGAVLTAFITFFLLYDGERIWQWVTSPFGSRLGAKVDAAGAAAWVTLSGYIRGSFLVATIHAVVIGVTLLILGVPLVAPLAVIVFVFSFLPLIGVLISGGLAVFVALGTKGLVAGIVVLCVLIVEHQVEGHLLQPFIVGRYVRLHPLAIALVLSIGGVLGGIVGAIVAVPVVAVIKTAWPILVTPELEVPEHLR